MTTKVCPRCGEEKGTGDFDKRASEPDGLRRECKVCEKAWRIRKRSLICERCPHRRRAAGPTSLDEAVLLAAEMWCRAAEDMRAVRAGGYT